CVRSGVNPVCDHGPQLLAGLEHRYGTRGHFDRVPRAGVARHTGFTAADLEGSETADLDVLLVGEGVLHRVEEAIYNAGTVFLADHRPGRPRDMRGYPFHKVGLG